MYVMFAPGVKSACSAAVAVAPVGAPAADDARIALLGREVVASCYPQQGNRCSLTASLRFLRPNRYYIETQSKVAAGRPTRYVVGLGLGLKVWQDVKTIRRGWMDGVRDGIDAKYYNMESSRSYD